MDNHTFKPSRPGGVVCVAERRPPAESLERDGVEACGYPAGHPIHATVPAGDLEPGDTPHGRPGDPLFDVNIVRGGVVACIRDTDPAYRVTLDALERLEAYVRRAGGAQ